MTSIFIFLYVYKLIKPSFTEYIYIVNIYMYIVNIYMYIVNIYIMCSCVKLSRKGDMIFFCSWFIS